MEEEFDEEQIDLKHYLHVLLKRRWIIVAVFVLVVSSVVVQMSRAIPYYRATARVLIEKENPNVVSIQEVMSVQGWGYDYYPTQYKIIQSRAVARTVVERLDLKNSPEFNAPPREDVITRARQWVSTRVSEAKGWVKELLRTVRPARPIQKEVPPEEQLMVDPDADIISAVIGCIDVQPLKDTRLVDVSVDARSPVWATRMANAVVRAYIDQNLEIKLKAAKDAVQWLSERISEERSKVEAAENALLQYKEENEIITNFSSDAEMVTAQKLASLNEQVVAVESQRVEAETRYRQALSLKKSPDLLDSLPDVLGNELVQSIKTMEVDLYNRISELSKKYGRNHPQMVAVQAELEDLEDRKGAAIKSVVNSLRNSYQLILAREKSLKKALADQKTESLRMNKKAIQYGVLKRQAESSQHMYDLLIRRFKETSLTEEMKTGNIRIIDEAQVPYFPIRPNKRRNIRLAMVVGLALGIGLAFLLEFLDNTFKLPDEIKQQLKIPYLGPVPAFNVSKQEDGVAGDLVAVHSPQSTVSESFRGIRTGIVYSSADEAPRVILVTSAGPLEGKSVTAANLAVTMAQAGNPVLLMDCDMRRPRLHRFFGTRRNAGVSSILVGSNGSPDAILSTEIENLDVLPCGPIPPNPSEILGSRKMTQVLDEFRQRYTRIVIDSPPLTAVTDATVLARSVDGVLLVIRAADTPRQVVKNGLEQLRSVQAPILGAVLNGVQAGRDGYYYQYYYYYYGEKDNPRKRSRRAARRAKKQGLEG